MQKKINITFNTITASNFSTDLMYFMTTMTTRWVIR
jgi:hypothetical protein